MSYELIETVEVGSGGASSIEFTSIPQDGTDLVLKLSGRNSATSVAFEIRPNSATTNLAGIRLIGTGSSASSFSDSALYAYVSASADTANTFGNTEIYISNYASSSGKSISIDGVNENNDTGSDQTIIAGFWDNTSAITSIELVPLGGGTAVQYTTASLYKITAA